MKTDPYLQFPLCALTWGDSEKLRLNTILEYGVVEAGIRLISKLPAEQRQQFVNAQLSTGKLPHGFNRVNQIHQAALYGASKLKVNYQNIGRSLQGHKELSHHFAVCFEPNFGRDALVRIKLNWLFKARDGNGLTYREFAVLCAIYSVIGNKKMARVTRDRIGHLALGYRTKKIMEKAIPQRTDGAKPLTIRQVRDTIDRLHRNRFFARATACHRYTYYSNRLNDADLRKAIIERRTYPAFFRASHAALDQSLTEAIRQQRQEAAKLIPQSQPSLS